MWLSGVSSATWDNVDAQEPYKYEWHIFLPGAIVMSVPGLKLGAMTRSKAQLHLGSVLMSMASLAIKNHADSQVWADT